MKDFRNSTGTNAATEERMVRVGEALAKQLSAAMAENIRLKGELADALTANAKLARALMSAETHCDTLKGVVSTLTEKIDGQSGH